MKSEDLPADAVHLDNERVQRLDQGRARAAAEMPVTDPLKWTLLPLAPSPRIFGPVGGALLIAGTLVMIALVAVLLAASYRSDMRFQDACIDAGGRVHSFSPQICVTEDGRIFQP